LAHGRAKPIVELVKHLHISPCSRVVLAELDGAGCHRPARGAPGGRRAELGETDLLIELCERSGLPVIAVHHDLRTVLTRFHHAVLLAGSMFGDAMGHGTLPGVVGWPS